MILPKFITDNPQYYEVDSQGNVWSWNFDHSKKSKVVLKGWLYDWKVNPKAVNGYFNSGTGAGNRNTKFWEDIKAKLRQGMPLEAIVGMDELVKRGITRCGWPTADNIWNYPELWGMFGYTPPEGYIPNCGMVANGMFSARELAANERDLHWYNLGRNWYHETGSVDPLAGYYSTK